MNMLILVNAENKLPKDYIPTSLVQDPVSKVWVKKEVYGVFATMNAKLQKEGLSSLVLISGYRSYDYQKKLFDRKIDKLMTHGLGKEEAINKARKIVAYPGTSEHQTGLAIDVADSVLAKEDDPLIEQFAQTEHGKWLEKHAHEYGFILRYPKDKTHITHITYEPWHYRYVGVEHAAKIKGLGVCLEEYASGC